MESVKEMVAEISEQFRRRDLHVKQLKDGIVNYPHNNREYGDYINFREAVKWAIRELEI
jgi:hypothetical protein